MLRLRVFGCVSVQRDGLQAAETAELHKALTLLALVAASEDRGITRDQLAAYFWPESNTEQARAALSQTLYVLRKQLGEPTLFLGTRTLRLNPAAIVSDLNDFADAVDQGEYEAVADIYAGPFLQGVFVPGCLDLERWIESKRADLAQQRTAAIEAAAQRASERGDFVAASSWWRRLVVDEPGNSRSVTALVSNLAASGDCAGALQAAHAHESFLRSEFGAPLDARLSTLVEDIRLGRYPVQATKTRDSAAASLVSKIGDAEPTPADVGSSVGRLTNTQSGGVHRSGWMRSRWFVAAAGLAVVATTVLIGELDWSRAETHGRLTSARRVAVTGFRNETGDTAFAFIGRLAVDYVIQGLTQTQLVEVVAPGVREGYLPRFHDAGSPSNASLIVRGSYSRTADSLVLQAQIVEALTGRVVRAVGPVSGSLVEPLDTIERLRQRIAGALATRVDPRLSRWSDAASQPVSFDAYRAFNEGLNAFFSPGDSSFATAGPLLSRAALLDTTYSLPLVWAIYAYFNAGEYERCDSVLRVFEARRDRLAPLDRALLDGHKAFLGLDPGGKYDAFRRVVAIAPNSEWVYKLADAALEVHRLHEADSLLSALDPDAGWMREWNGYWALRAITAYEQGKHEDELTIVKEAAARRPEVGLDVRFAGRALAALGRRAEVLSLVDGALASTPPRVGSYGLFAIISAARVHGHVDIATAVAERTLRRSGAQLDLDAPRVRARFELMVLEASENWTAAVQSARRLIRLDSLSGHHDALPYIVLLEAAVLRGAVQDTTGLEAKALDEATKSTQRWPNVFAWENPATVRAELAALRGDIPRTAELLWEAVRRDFWDLKTDAGDYERAAFDRVRTDPMLAKLLHNPAVDRPPTR